MDLKLKPEFIERMEDVLEIYKFPYNEQRLVVSSW